MKTATDTVTQTPTQILNELRALVIEGEKIVGNDVTGCCESAAAALRERLEAAQERLANFYDDARQRVVIGAKRADDTIRANPYQSIAIAVGLGLLAGILLGRTSKR